MALYNDHHEVITKEEVEKLRYIIIIIMKFYTKEEVEKLRYVMIIMKL